MLVVEVQLKAAVVMTIRMMEMAMTRKMILKLSLKTRQACRQILLREPWPV